MQRSSENPGQLNHIAIDDVQMSRFVVHKVFPHYHYCQILNAI
jgi:hypothetical protein